MTRAEIGEGRIRLLPDSLRHLTETYWSPPRPDEPPPSPHDVTVVTAFFDIGRGDWGGAVRGRPIPGWLTRSSETYLGYFRLLARLKNDMVIFSERRLAEEILAARAAHGLESRTEILVIDDLLRRDATLAATRRRIEATMKRHLTEFAADPTKPEVWSPDYVLVTNLKPLFVTTALDLGLVRRRQVAWIDFGYCRYPDSFNPDYPWHYDCGNRLHLLSILPIDDRSMREIVRTGYCPIHGAQVFGLPSLWSRFAALFEVGMSELLSDDLADDDQGLMLMALRAAPDLFSVHAVNKRDRSCVFRLFNSAVPPHLIPPPPRRSRRTPQQRIRNEFERFVQRLRGRRLTIPPML